MKLNVCKTFLCFLFLLTTKFFKKSNIQDRSFFIFLKNVVKFVNVFRKSNIFTSSGSTLKLPSRIKLS